MYYVISFQVNIIMKVDIRFSKHQHPLMFTLIYFPAIEMWLDDMKIQYTIDLIKVFEWIDCPIENYYTGGYGETVVRGRRYIFNNYNDAVLFKFRWAHSDIDETDESVQKYLTRLRRGFNQVG